MDQMSLRTECDRIIDRSVAKSAELAGVKRLTQGEVSRAFYIRHVTETIIRIRLARIADGKAISLLASLNPVAAALWCRYADEEMLHDRMFLRDIKALGVTADEVYSHDPLPATKMLQGYLYYTLKHEGPMALLGKAYFLESFTFKTQKSWNAHIAASLGRASVQGANAHLTLDGEHDHSGDVWDVLQRVVNSIDDERRLVNHMKVFEQLVEMYFADLERAVISGFSDAGFVNAPIRNLAGAADSEYEKFELEEVA